MSFDRATELVAAMAGAEAEPGARALAVRLRAASDPSAIADALVASTAPDPESKDVRVWRIASSLVAVVAGVLATRGLADLERVLPGEPSGLFFLPLLAVPLVAIAWVVGPLVRPQLARRARARVATRVLDALLHAGAEDALAMETAGWVAELERRELADYFEGEDLRRTVALAGLFHRPAPKREVGGLLATLGVAAALAWVVITFWAGYFTAFGRAAMAAIW